MAQDQKHPQEQRDRQIVNELLMGDPNDHNLAELARLRIRYCNFPGARQLSQDLDLILEQWQLAEADLFEKTRQLHEKGKVYKRASNEDVQDWT
ncbi:DUF3288 family protein [Crocosphaera chwakensis]|uniref:DUF3288 family protein n=1 Tax=Crocosphaera chwakensis CCY0110 TaxID=391612 RepID=A3IUJ2_9CHRO|nr:DUF3288 family protein [Crocosphaera chwakensis]EAZ89879.1 hypothetical protein CY0110_06324 [Crocosphaera chwakensis CCY0110]